MAPGSQQGARLRARMPLRDVSTLEEQAAVILFLTSDAATFVHGAIVDANGKLLSRHPGARTFTLHVRGTTSTMSRWGSHHAKHAVAEEEPCRSI